MYTALTLSPHSKESAGPPLSGLKALAKHGSLFALRTTFLMPDCVPGRPGTGLANKHSGLSVLPYHYQREPRTNNQFPDGRSAGRARELRYSITLSPAPGLTAGPGDRSSPAH
ncbi:hypothetical protein AAFF_G00093920 [Aldrovandia affinis]|uniref:Uncharacterized protein n=1 Tax=Aldrovandia affinis TaxID=143900 RepID=A0AAD7WXM3_9TELE|nr:hypothetical protein AAFF_G00093920 [Aldrovandia affinis]